VAGVVWDLGKVLVEWEPFAAVAAGVGEAEARRFFEGFDFHAWNHLCDAGRPWEDALAELERDHREWAAHGRAYYENFAASLTGAVPGTADILRSLHDAGVPQCGLTNWSHELFHAHAPRRFPFLSLLDHVVVSGTEGIAKPDRRIYDIAAERSGIPHTRLVFVDDKPANVESAEALGMRGVVFTGADALRKELRSLGLPA
jgi:2-haloacid dehalogenase